MNTSSEKKWKDLTMLLKSRKTKILTAIVLSITMILAIILQPGIVLIVTFKEKGVSSDNIDEEEDYFENIVNSDKIFEIRDDTKLKRGGYWDLTDSPIFIDGDATGVGPHNWEWVENQQWFGGGDGTQETPYIIENITINGQASGSCIFIQDSNKHFIIRNCMVYNSGLNGGDAGIRLKNTNSGKVINNNCSLNYYGIYLENSNDNIISGNIVNNNRNDGIMFIYSSFNNISCNDASFNGDDGIHLIYSLNNSIYNNDVFNNSLYGIGLSHASHNNTIENNILVDNHNRGLGIYSLCKDNIDINNIEYRTYEPDFRASEAYALLISGVNDMASIPYMKTELVDKFKMKPENIFTLSDKWVGSRPLLTRQIVYEAFDNISKLIDSNDIFLFFISVHGNHGGSYLLPFFSYSDVGFSEDFSLQEYLDKIYCAEQYVFIQSCQAGAYNDEIPPSLCAENRFLFSPCKADDISFANIYSIFLDSFKSPGVFEFQKGDFNKDGFVDLNEAYKYIEYYKTILYPSPNIYDPVLSDRIYNTINNPVDGIQPIIANISEKSSEGNTHIDLNFTIDGIGYIKSINIWLLKNSGKIFSNISVPVIYSRNGGQGRYNFSHKASEMIGTYFIYVKYEYSDRNTVYNRFIDNDHNNIPDWTDFIDSDGDGISDYREKFFYKTDPNDADSDDDRLTDWQELFYVRTDPNDNDSDNDGYLDGDEIDNETDPLDPNDPSNETIGELSNGNNGDNGRNDNNHISNSEFLVIAIISAILIISLISIVSSILINKRLKH